MRKKAMELSYWGNKTKQQNPIVKKNEKWKHDFRDQIYDSCLQESYSKVCWPPKWNVSKISNPAYERWLFEDDLWLAPPKSTEIHGIGPILGSATTCVCRKRVNSGSSLLGKSRSLRSPITLRRWKKIPNVAKTKTAIGKLGLWKRREEFIFFVEIHNVFFWRIAKKKHMYIYIYIYLNVHLEMPWFMDLTILEYHIQVTLKGAAQVSSPLALPLHPPHHHRRPARPGRDAKSIHLPPSFGDRKKKRTT